MKYLGYKQVFDAPIDLSNILEQSKKTEITMYRVKAAYTVKVQFDETTTKTMISAAFSPSSKKHYEENIRIVNNLIRADHPFVYLICTNTNLIALGGVLYHP